MPKPSQPLFLARASYRKRRLRDGARLLPIFGGFLLMLPLLWRKDTASIVGHWTFVFVVWAGLIVITALVSRRLGEAEGLGEFAPDLPAGDLAAPAANGGLDPGQNAPNGAP